MRSAEISGISPNFLELSQSQGQVAHVLLTRSPLEHPPEGAVSFDLHVLSTPPAFVLSQDQTLRRCSTQAENRDLTIAESINPKKPTRKTPKGPPGREYYLALTFGTLLSSQGADAHQIHPSGLHRWRLVQPTPHSTVGSAWIFPPAPRGGLARRSMNVTPPWRTPAAGPGTAGSDIPWFGVSSRGGGELGPGGVLAVEGPGLETAVQDADESVAELAQGGVVADSAGADG